MPKLLFIHRRHAQYTAGYLPIGNCFPQGIGVVADVVLDISVSPSVSLVTMSHETKDQSFGDVI